MALVLADRVQETTTTTGTGTVTLAGAVSGYQSFAAIGNANTTYYTIADQSGTNWEVGIGTYTSSGTTLSRDTVLSSSNSGSLVNFGAGTKNVFCDYSAVTGLYITRSGSTINLQAQPTDSTATGGNARGANAVDWQTARGNANQVASGGGAVIAGGVNNRTNGFYSSVSGGNGCTVSGAYASIGGGTQNIINNDFSFIGAGYLNTAAGFYNLIGGGYGNSATSGSAVTTQSGTMNATTAVTLSGSNASIKVGQLISGTSISSGTYVAAISGTSLTLSQNASGSSTNTLSFYTPHGVVVGGGNNQATGSYSFIGGGGDAGTAANRNVASGDWSTVSAGYKNQATGNYSTIGGGNANTVSNTYSTIAGGIGNQANGIASTVVGGTYNYANASMSTVSGRYGTDRSVEGNAIFAACFSPLGGTLGYSQAGLLVLAKQTTDATATVLTSNSSAASGTNQVILPNNSAYYIRGSVIAGVTGAGNTKAWTFECAIKRGSGVGTTAIVGTAVVNTIAQDSGASAWTIALSADTTNGGLSVTVTGQASTTIRWVCRAESTEMTY